MNEPTADVKSWSEACRLSLTPLLRIQQDGLGALDRLARCQYAVAGDFLELSLALSKITLLAQSPADFLTKQAELGIKFREQLRSRVQELTIFTSAEQSTASPAFAVATAVAPVINMNTPAPAALTLVTIRAHAASDKSSAESTGPALTSTTPPAQPIAATVDARAPARKVGPASVKSSPPLANADAGRPSEVRLHLRDPAPRSGESTSKDRFPGPSRTTRDGGKPKNRNKT